MGELTLGMNPAEVRDFAKAVDAAAQSLGEIRTTLTGKLGSTTWDGQDAASFRSAWSSSHAPSIASAVQALEAAATTARSNADAQERTSAGDDGSAGTANGANGADGGGVTGGRVGSSLPVNRTHLGGWTENTFQNGKGTAEAGWGADAKYGTSGTLGTANYSASGESGAGGKAWVSADYGLSAGNVTSNDPLAQRDASQLYDKRRDADDGNVAVSKQGLHANVGAGAEVGAWSKGQASIHNGGFVPTSAAANYDALVGARAQGAAGGALSWDGARVG
ncbi:MAG TPA: hypothetical protein VJR25_07625, partial [Microbacterium sp.]|uniref:WXG100 family type VII secretion target n=1 Tax=Microbacterium sp. TaxID=51671 RepID=UPI002B6E2F4D|nr:hypothetical protein [Microbacterium sp.]